MAKLSFNQGVEVHEVIGANGAEVAKFYLDSGDSNLINRFRAFLDELPTVSEKYEAARKMMPESVRGEDGEVDTAVWDAGEAIRDADLYIKARLSEVFGASNDFDAIFEGSNVMSIALNGSTAIENFIDAVAPLMQGGIEARDAAMKEKASTAVIAAKQNRAQRRAPTKK